MIRKLTYVLGLPKRLQEERSPKKETLPLWQSALKWGSRRGGARLHPFLSHRSIAFTCAPVADSVFASGAQSEVRAMIQQFPYRQASPSEL